MTETVVIEGRRYAVEERSLPLVQNISNGSFAVWFESGPPTEIGKVPKSIHVLPIDKDFSISKRKPYWTSYEKWVKIKTVKIKVPAFECTAEGKPTLESQAPGIIVLVALIFLLGFPTVWTIIAIVRNFTR